jgi:REP element-mobilizing transposase RayT
MHLFAHDADFEGFQRVMIEAHRRHPIGILSYCILSNHWHFVVWPQTDEQKDTHCGAEGAEGHALRSRRTHTARSRTRHLCHRSLPAVTWFG